MVDKVSSIGIHGMGGSGKTTLAKHIYNQLLKEPHECVFWITVSQAFTIKSLQDEVARLVGLDLVGEHNEDFRATRLNEVLSKKENFVLILDDVWKSINFKKLGDPLSVGGKLIITTRSFDVCNQIDSKEVVQVNALNNSEAWDLFTETLGKELAPTPEIQEIAKDMAKRCGGLPLAIITTAGSMKGKNDVCEWRNASVELKELMMSENVDEEKKVFEILKYSFDQLDRGEEKHKGYTKLQHCFLYCCLYPEDHKIQRTELIELFMSEEFLDRKRSRRKRVDQGHAMLNKLVRACLLESDETGQWVKMHDVIRAMALKITEGIYMRIDWQKYKSKECLNEEYWTEELEKVSLMWMPGSKSSMLHIPAEWTPNCPKLSTLLLSDNDSFGVIPAASFTWMHNLHVLNMSCCTRLEKLPDPLSNLKSLRSLLLSNCDVLKYVPYLGNLKELRELDISDTSIREVPQGMEELANLESLKIDAEELENIPGNLLLNFRKLQCLHLPFGIEAPVTEIVRLKQLEEFRGPVKDATDLISLMALLPRLKEYNRSYCVCVGEYDRSLDFGNGFHRAVMMCRLTQEGWTNATLVAVVDIEELAVRSCEGLSSCFLDDVQRLNVNCKPLNYLQIVNCRGIECVLRQEQLPIEGDLKYPFCNLREMQFRMLDDFRGVMISERAGALAASHAPVFSSLKKLIITFCPNMKTMGLPVWELQNLEELQVWSCSKIEEIIEVGDEYGVGNQSLPIVHLPKLKSLQLQYLYGLKSICSGVPFLGVS